MQHLMRNTLGSSGKQWIEQNSVTLVEGGKVLTEPSEVVVSNNYVGWVIALETHRGSVENFSDHPSVRGITSIQVFEHPLTFEPVSSAYVKEILENLNPRKAVGAYGISPRLLRLSAPVMAEEITHLINVLKLFSSWPNEWKCSNLTPVFKKDEDPRKESIALCRPFGFVKGLWESYVRSAL